MPKILIITEKPSQAQDISKALFGKSTSNGNFEGNHIYIQSLVGHILRTKEPKEIIKDLKWSYDVLPLKIKELEKVVASDKVSIFKNIDTLIKNENFDFVISSTDPDREGSNLFWEVIEKVGKKIEVKRFLPTSKDPNYIKQNILTKFVDTHRDKLWYEAGEARAFTDYHFGMNNTILFSLKIGELVPVGRVKLGVLGILYKRFKDRENYIAKFGEERAFYTLKGNFGKDSSSYDGLLNLKDKIYNKEEIENIKKIINDEGKGEIITLETNKKESFGGKPYKLSTLQKECGKLFKWSADKTLGLLDHLYNENKLSTYPRSKQELIHVGDKKYMLEQYELMKKIHGLENHEFHDPQTRVFTSKELEHYGIFGLAREGYLDDDNGINNKSGKFSSTDLLKLYHLLIIKMFKVFSKPKITNEMVIETKCKEYLFKTKDIDIVDDGYVKIEKDLFVKFGYKKNSSSSNDSNPSIIGGNHLKKGDLVDIKSLTINEGKEKAPNFIEEADLAPYCEDPKKFLEEDSKNSELVKHFPEAGIGTSATISGIIKDMKEKELIYVEKDGRFRIGEKGVTLLSILPEKFKDLLFTAKLEKNLDDIAEGKINLKDYIEDSYNEIINDVKENIQNIKQFKSKSNAEQLEDKCPKCNKGNLVKVQSKKNKKYYVLCSTGKEKCDFIAEWDTTNNKIIENKGYSGDELKIKCPNCKINLLENNKTVFCNDCGFTLWKETFKKKLSKSIIKEIIEKGKTSKKVSGLKSKAGKSFEAFIVLVDDKGKTKIEFN